MRDWFSQLTGSCPGSNEQVGAQYAGKQVVCQACNRKVQVNARGVVHSHFKNEFLYLDTSGGAGDLVYTGIESRGSESERFLYFGFAVSGWGAERWAARMAFSLKELKRLHEFLGSAISDIEQACTSNPAFNAQVKRASDQTKYQSRPPIVY